MGEKYIYRVGENDKIVSYDTSEGVVKSREISWTCNVRQGSLL